MREMEQIEVKKLTTAQGNQVEFRFELSAADMKWVSCMSGKLNNCAVYFSFLLQMLTRLTKLQLVAQSADQVQPGNPGTTRRDLKLQRGFNCGNQNFGIQMESREVRLLNSLLKKCQDRNLYLH